MLSVNYTNKQSISSHFKLSANHADKQVMSHFVLNEPHVFCCNIAWWAKQTFTWDRCNRYTEYSLHSTSKNSK